MSYNLNKLKFAYPQKLKSSRGKGLEKFSNTLKKTQKYIKITQKYIQYLVEISTNWML